MKSNGHKVRIGKLSEFRPQTANANKHTERGLRMLDDAMSEDGYVAPMTAVADAEIIDGSARLERAFDKFNDEAIILEHDGTKPIITVRTDIPNANTKEAKRIAVRANRIAEVDLEWDASILQTLEPADLEGMFSDKELAEILTQTGIEPKDATVEPEKAAECQQKWQVVTGEIIQIGAHLLMCADSRDPATFRALMRDEKAVLCHADPPYGMGKENDGVANDNLYREKLDAFQMAWWRAVRPSLEDNASAYIWGNAEDLWRLWYVGGLSTSERLTLRNEITWNKGHGQGMESDAHRMFPTASERCLFFMLSEQGFNNNADNYWEGWDSVRSYLDAEIKKMYEVGWTRKRIDVEIFGCTVTSGGMVSHYTGTSQWAFITQENYQKLQLAAKGKAFSRPYDDLRREHDKLKREFYATRAYFDNTHDNMTDVWDFPRVEGEERWEHSTPKPVAMVQRIVKSSSPEGAIVVDPMAGSGPSLVACENTGRRARAVELKPEYCALICERMTTAFPHLKIEKVDQARAVA